jgi:hypothetical protein
MFSKLQILAGASTIKFVLKIVHACSKMTTKYRKEELIINKKPPKWEAAKIQMIKNLFSLFIILLQRINRGNNRKRRKVTV